jgi:hypothetical protein
VEDSKPKSSIHILPADLHSDTDSVLELLKVDHFMPSPQKNVPDKIEKMGLEQFDEKNNEFMFAKSAVQEEDEEVEVENNPFVGNTDAFGHLHMDEFMCAKSVVQEAAEVKAENNDFVGNAVAFGHCPMKEFMCSKAFVQHEEEAEVENNGFVGNKEFKMDM